MLYLSSWAEAATVTVVEGPDYYRSSNHIANITILLKVKEVVGVTLLRKPGALSCPVV